jgi:hypothetical protein
VDEGFVTSFIVRGPEHTPANSNPDDAVMHALRTPMPTGTTKMARTNTKSTRKICRRQLFPTLSTDDDTPATQPANERKGAKEARTGSKKANTGRKKTRVTARDAAFDNFESGSHDAALDDFNDYDDLDETAPKRNGNKKARTCRKKTRVTARDAGDLGAANAVTSLDDITSPGHHVAHFVEGGGAVDNTPHASDLDEPAPKRKGSKKARTGGIKARKTSS